MGEGIAEFMARRRREVERMGREAAAAAHEAYGKANQAGRKLALKTQAQVMQYGARLLEGERPPTPRSAPKRPASLLETPVARKIGGDAARAAGNAVGLARGAVHAAEGLVEAAAFAHRVAYPIQDLLRDPQNTASAQVGRSLLKAVDYAKEGISNPASVVRDIADGATEFRRKIDPTATPAAPTFSGELRRNFETGKNQGEVAFDVGSLAIGGPAAAATKFLVPVKVSKAEKYLGQGFSPRAAAYLATPYEGMGHHFAGRRLKLPERFSESEFNVLKPPGMTRGDFYELHFKVDPHFYGTTLRPRSAGERWTGKALGLEKHAPAGRIWHGSPTPLKARAIGLTAGVGAQIHNPPPRQGEAR
jgi:hypothetical protein